MRYHADVADHPRSVKSVLTALGLVAECRGGVVEHDFIVGDEEVAGAVVLGRVPLAPLAEIEDGPQCGQLRLRLVGRLGAAPYLRAVAAAKTRWQIS